MNIQANAPSPLLPQSSVQRRAYFWELTLPIIKQHQWAHKRAHRVQRVKVAMCMFHTKVQSDPYINSS